MVSNMNGRTSTVVLLLGMVLFGLSSLSVSVSVSAESTSGPAAEAESFTMTAEGELPCDGLQSLNYAHTR